MPMLAVDWVPLPSLRFYSALSILWVIVVLWPSSQINQSQVEVNVSHNVQNQLLTASKLDLTKDVCIAPTYEEILTQSQDCQFESETFDEPSMIDLLINSSFTFWMIEAIFQDFWTACAMINACYCLWILLGHAVLNVVFGQLRVIERQHLKDKFWNLLFYKFIFVFGVLNVQSMVELLLWAFWFSVVGFLSLFTQLAKDRFEYLSFSPATPRHVHVRLLALLAGLQLAAFASITLAAIDVRPQNPAVFLFMAADCIILVIRILYVVVKYALHLYDLAYDGMWENRAHTVYYTEFSFEMLILLLEFSHHLYMLLYGHIYLSMASLVICMQLRHLFHELQRRWHRHRNYRRVMAAMELRFPWCNSDELDSNNDNCAICWDRMDRARKLPCGHMFHNSCLRSWLEQDTSCPTCRKSLSESTPAHPPQAPNPPPAAQRQPPARTTNTFNHFFHFDGPRYVSWFPRFSVEVTHTRFDPLSAAAAPLLGQEAEAISSQLDEMIRQVQQVFPHLPVAAIRNDLVSTRSVELTIENILDGQLPQGPRSDHTPTDSEHVSDSEASSDNWSSAELPQDDAGYAQSLFEPLSQIAPLEASAETQLVADETVESFSSAESTNTGGRFSKCSNERESILRTRKQELLAEARRKYLARQRSLEDTPSTSGGGGNLTQLLDEPLD